MPTVSDSIPPALRARLASLAREHEEIERRLNDPEVLGDHRLVRDLAIRKAALEPSAADLQALERLERDEAELQAALDAGDPELADLAKAELPALRARAHDIARAARRRLVTADDQAVGAVMLELRAGTGGDEAALWAQDLLQMYQRYASSRGWDFELLETGETTGAGGLRHAVASVRGPGVWTELSFEAGVHSVKRVPATETQGRIHTSTATVAVLPEPRDVDIKIDWARDVEEHVTTSQGPGGQNVNKVATAVQLHHRASGIVIRMQESKSQQQNRERARRLLLARLYDIERQRADAERSAQRRGQIGSAERSEKIRTYRYQEGIVADTRLETKFPLRDVLAGDLGPLLAALTEQEIDRRLDAMEDPAD